MTPQEYLETVSAEGSLHDRFLLRNGQEFAPRKRIGRRRPPKACFANARHFVMSHPEATYVEGLVFTKVGIPAPHAWVTTNGNDAMDPTLDAQGRSYWGVKFTTEQLEKYWPGLGSNGLLGAAFNTGLYADIDPELMKEISAGG
jgi:hypothetical protein